MRKLRHRDIKSLAQSHTALKQQNWDLNPGRADVTITALGQLTVDSPHSHISPHSHANKTWIVAVPTGQSWVTIPREQLTTADKLLVWAAKAGQPLWTPVFVNLETQSNRREWGYALCGVGCPGGPDSMHLGLPFCSEARCPPIVP